MWIDPISGSELQRVAVVVERLLRDANVGVALFDGPARHVAEPVAQRRVLEQPLDLAHKRQRIFAFREQSVRAVLDQFRQSARVARDDGSAGGHRLEAGVGAVLPEARDEVDIALAQTAPDLFQCDLAEVVHRTFQGLRLESWQQLLLHEAVGIGPREGEGDRVPLEDRFADLRAEVDALALLHPAGEEDDEAVLRQAEPRARVDLRGLFEEVEVDPVRDHLHLAPHPHLVPHLVGEEAAAGGECVGAADADLLDERAGACVCLARVVGRHDQLRRRVELDHGLHVREPVDQQPLAAALGHLHQVVLERAPQLLEGEVHAPAVLEAVLGPPEAVLVETLQRLHYAAAGAIAVDGDRVVRRRAQQRLLRRPGEDVDLVAEPCQRARLVPGVGPDPAEAGLGRVFEGEEGDSHRRNVDIEWISDHLGIGKFNNESAFRQAEDSKEITSKRSRQRSTVTFG